MNKTYQCDVQKIERYQASFQTEHQVTMVYNMLTGTSYSITNSLNNWMKRMYKLKAYSKNLKRHCLGNIKHFMLKDIKSLKYQSGYQSNYVASNALRNYLLQKYPWFDWIDLGFDTDKDTQSQINNVDGQFWSFPGVNNGRRNIIASSLDKGTFKTSVKAEIAEMLNYILQYDIDDVHDDKKTDVYFNHITDKGARTLLLMNCPEKRLK